MKRIAKKSASKKPVAKPAAKNLTAKKLTVKKVTTKKQTLSTAASLRQAALEATGLAEELLHARKVQADIGLETKGKTFYAVVRVRVEDLPALLG
jgi:hypothetical protein